MAIKEKIYTVLCCLFTMLIVTGNLVYQKFVCLPILTIHIFEISAGAILYPLTFLITDLISEFYGKKNAGFCVKLAIIINIIVNLFIAFIERLDATNWSQIDDETFSKVFGLYNIAFIASVIANYIAQTTDIAIYLWIRKLTNGKFLWLRNNASVAVSLLIDTSIVIGFMTIFRALPFEQMLPLILNSYIYKLFFSICSTPLFYISIYSIKHFINKHN